MSMSVTTTLTRIVYHLCNAKEENLRDKKQYEAQKAAFVAEIYIVKEAIVINADSIVNEEEYRQFIIHKSRSLTFITNLLEDAISQKEHTDSFTTSLLKEALSHTGVLNYFISYYYSPVLESSSALSGHFTDIEKIKLNVSAGGMAVLTKALVKSAQNISLKSQEAIVSYVVANFNSKRTDDLAVTTFKKNYRNPNPGALNDAIGFLRGMITYIENL